MAQAVQSETIVDLTDEGDDDGRIARANAHFEKAFAAASRLTHHFESIRPSGPTPLYKKPKKNTEKEGDSGDKRSFPAASPRTRVPPLVGTFPNLSRYGTNGFMKDAKSNATLPPDFATHNPTASPAPSAISVATQRPAKPFPVLEEEVNDKRQPRQTASATPGNVASNVRTPRSAALSAKQNIAETCNELEEWVSKDPKIIPQQAGVSTPRKSGRPKKDSDEWSPGSNTKNNVEPGKGSSKSITTTPTSLAGTSGDLAVNKHNSSFSLEGASTSLGIKKRKPSSSSLPNDSPVKSAKLNETPCERHGYKPRDLDESANKNDTHEQIKNRYRAGCLPQSVYSAIRAAKAKYKNCLADDELNGIANNITDEIMDRGVEAFCQASANGLTSQRTEYISNFVSAKFDEKALESQSDLELHLERVPSSNSAVETNSKLLSKSPKAESRENDISTKPTKPHLLEKIDPRLQRGYLEVSNLTASEPGLSSVLAGSIKFTGLFESVVYPTIKKSKKRYKDDLSQGDLDDIDKTITNDVLERLPSHPENSYQPDEDEKKKIKSFIKRLFRQKVRKANAQPSRRSGTPPKDLRHDVATVSSGSSALEGTIGDRSHMLGGVNYAENTSSCPDVAVNRRPEAQTPHQAHFSSPNKERSLSLQNSRNESSITPFAPGFDRGRYPALRRRRGNKYYTPARTTLKTNQASTQHSNNLGTPNTRDQLRLVKSYADRTTIPYANETQLLATPPAEKKLTPTNQDSALDLLTSIEQLADLEPAAPEPASYVDVSKGLRKGLARHQEGATEVGETTVGSRGPIFSHLAKSRNEAAIDQRARRLRRQRVLGNTALTEGIRPSFRRKLATAMDPNLEHVVAVLVTDTSSRPSNDGQRYSVTPTNRTQLVVEQNIVKNVYFDSNTGKEKLVRLETKVIDPMHHSGRCISSLLRNRELGQTSRGRRVGTINELHQLKSEMIEPWKDWKGASGDVVAVAWSPDSNVYAFGAAAHTNIEDIQYNRPCNLLLGNLTSNQIRELPDHRVDRPRPDTIPSGPNANQAVYDACDPQVYETVTSIAFSPTGDRMFTASHDCTVKIWDISGGKHQCLGTLRHEAWVTSLEISKHRPGLFATASKCVKDAVRIYYENACYANFSASRAESRPDWRIYPECLGWGPNPYNSHLLLAGFQQWEQQEDLLSGGGQLCLWDAFAFESIKVTPSSQSVYAAAWHPTEPFFATGGAPGNNVADKINTKTVVRIWDYRNPKRYQVEYECPAIDMQDITFCPLNSNIVTAGCTDGVSYVWDWRWPDQPLHRLKHGRPLVDLDHTRQREEADTGVMLSLWGPGGSLFYSGSSDGIIKAWDVRRHPNDVLISNVAKYDVSIQSGAFSPDGNNLLVGDAEGGIHVLSSAPCGPRSNVKSADAYIDLVRASNGSGLRLNQEDDNPGTEGIEAAKLLIESGQLQYHKELGVGQGPNYRGPYATYARKEAAESAAGRLRKKFEKKQPISKRGEKRWDIAIPMTSLLYERKETLDRQKDSVKMMIDNPGEHKPNTIQRSNGGELLRTSPSFPITEGALAPNHSTSTSLMDSPAGEDIGAAVADGTDKESVEYNTISESEMIEENYWWVRLGEEDIDQARAGRVGY